MYIVGDGTRNANAKEAATDKAPDRDGKKAMERISIAS